MPLVHVEWLAGRSHETKAAVAKEITDALVRHAGADPGHVWIIFEDRSPADWAAGGRILAPPPAPPMDGGQ